MDSWIFLRGCIKLFWPVPSSYTHHIFILDRHKDGIDRKHPPKSQNEMPHVNLIGWKLDHIPLVPRTVRKCLLLILLISYNGRHFQQINGTCKDTKPNSTHFVKCLLQVHTIVPLLGYLDENVDRKNPNYFRNRQLQDRKG